MSEKEIRDAIEDANLMFHDQAREIERLKYARFADSNDLELARIHLNTLHLAITALRAQIEPGWIKVSPESMPREGQKVEIRRTSDYYTAIYRPSENQFIPWELLDDSGRKTMLWRRREVVDEWRSLPEPPKDGEK